jgi:hypothetical protein
MAKRTVNTLSKDTIEYVGYTPSGYTDTTLVPKIFVENSLSKAITGLTYIDGALTLTNYSGTSTNIPIPSPTEQVFNAIATGDTQHTIYTLSDNFIPNSTRVFVNGLRMTIGQDYDYKELQENSIKFNYALTMDDTVVVDYLK